MRSVSKLLFAMLCCCGLANVPANADSTNVAGMMTNVGKSALSGFAQPLVTVLGSGMNSGWYVSAKPLSMLGLLPVGVSIAMVDLPIVVVDNSMKTFNFTGELPTKPILKNLSLPGGTSLDALSSGLMDSLAHNSVLKSALQQALPGVNLDSLGIDHLIQFHANNQPTILGSDSAKKVPLDTFLAGSKTLNTIKAYNASRIYADSIAVGSSYSHRLSATDTINLAQPVPLPFRGIGNKIGGIMFSLPTIAAEIGVSKIPVIDNLTLGFRYVPDIDLKSISSDMPFSSVGLFGFKVQYEYLHLVPLASHLPFKSSVIFAESGFHLGKSSDTVYLNQSNWMLGVNASWDLHVAAFGVGIFTGIDYESSNLDLNVKMHEIDPALDDFSVSIPGTNHFHFTIGPRFDIGPVEIFGAANFGSVTLYNIGVTAPLALNGR